MDKRAYRIGNFMRRAGFMGLFVTLGFAISGNHRLGVIAIAISGISLVLGTGIRSEARWR